MAFREAFLRSVPGLQLQLPNGLLHGFSSCSPLVDLGDKALKQKKECLLLKLLHYCVLFATHRGSPGSSLLNPCRIRLPDRVVFLKVRILSSSDISFMFSCSQILGAFRVLFLNFSMLLLVVIIVARLSALDFI